MLSERKNPNNTVPLKATPPDRATHPAPVTAHLLVWNPPLLQPASKSVINYRV